MAIKNFFFVDKFNLEEGPDYLIGRIPKGVNSASQLLELIEDQLHFPEYFGCNWNALYDCLRDFDWTVAKIIVLAHDDLPRLSDDELRTYLETLRDAAADWKLGEAHELRVIFANSNMDDVLRLLGET